MRPVEQLECRERQGKWTWVVPYASAVLSKPTGTGPSCSTIVLIGWPSRCRLCRSRRCRASCRCRPRSSQLSRHHGAGCRGHRVDETPAVRHGTVNANEAGAGAATRPIGPRWVGAAVRTRRFVWPSTAMPPRVTTGTAATTRAARGPNAPHASARVAPVVAADSWPRSAGRPGGLPAAQIRMEQGRSHPISSEVRRCTTGTWRCAPEVGLVPACCRWTCGGLVDSTPRPAVRCLRGHDVGRRTPNREPVGRRRQFVVVR